MDKLTKKNEALMADIVTLVNELSDDYQQQLGQWATLTLPEKQAGKRRLVELEQTICSKLVEVKYFESLGDSLIKVTAATEGRPMYLEIVTVFEGAQPSRNGFSAMWDAPAEFEFQLHPITGWLPMFRSCKPATALQYQAAVDLAIEKGAVVV